MSNEFDYIIIGGGTAGLVIASRLSEVPEVQVLVLEAGTDRSTDPNVVIPGLSFNCWSDPTLLWPFMSVPQKDVHDRVIPHFRGKALGGTSAINALILGRATKAEYDALETEIGNKDVGWNWDSLVDYFRKSETSSAPYNSALTGSNGPIHRSAGSTGYVDPVHQKFFEAMENHAGVPIIKDSADAANNLGSGFAPGAIDPVTGKRSYSASGYYDPIKETRKNLTVWTGVQATRIILSEDAGPRVLGVEYTNEQKETKEVKVRKEVISCAGAYQSPQILELSGIGRKDVLDKAGIKLRVELDGVGENLQDHVSTFYMGELTGDSCIKTFDDASLTPLTELPTHIDPAMSQVLTQGFTWIPSKYYTEQCTVEKWKKIAEEKGGNKTVALQTKWLSDDTIPSLELAHIGGYYPIAAYPLKEAGKRYFSVVVALAHPLSRGSVHIGETAEDLVIDAALLSNPVDVQMLVEGLKFVRKLTFEESLGVKEVTPGKPAEGGPSEDEFLENYVKSSLSTVFHPLGTCAMMPKADGGVVDERCRVYGVKGLRVVDAGILPFEFAAHPCATIYAVAEKAADIIKQDI